MKRAVIILVLLASLLFIAGNLSGKNVLLSQIISDIIPPFVTVLGASEPWQNNATASVFCLDPGIITDCDNSTFMLKINANNSSCSTNFSDYSLASPKEISDHVWVCGAAKDKAENTGFSPAPIEFKVDKQSPELSNLVVFPESPVNFSENQTYQFNVTVTDNVQVENVILEFDNANYTDLIEENGIYSKIFENLAAKNYTFRWLASDLVNNWAQTDPQTYSVLAAINETNQTNETENNTQPTPQQPPSSGGGGSGGAAIGFTQSFSIVAPNSVSIEQGKFGVITIIIRNNGPSFSNISLKVENLPESWVRITPSSQIIDATSFKEFAINITIPQNEAFGNRTFQLRAKDSLEILKSIDLVITRPVESPSATQSTSSQAVTNVSTTANATETNANTTSPVGAFILTNPTFIGGMIALIFISVLLYLYQYRREEFMQLKEFFKMPAKAKFKKAEIEVESPESGESVKYTVSYEE